MVARKGQALNPTGKGGFGDGRKPDNSGGSYQAIKVSAGKRINAELFRAAMDNDAANVKKLIAKLWKLGINGEEWAIKYIFTRIVGPDGTLDGLIGDAGAITGITINIVHPTHAPERERTGETITLDGSTGYSRTQ